MKKLLALVVAIAALESCSISYPARLITTSTSTGTSAGFQTTTVVADIKVSETKISFLYIPSKTVIDAGYENIINTAVREALVSAGKQYDVLVARETQVKYTPDGEIESVLITGYPGQYTNWRSSQDVIVVPVSENKTTTIIQKN